MDAATHEGVAAIVSAIIAGLVAWAEVRLIPRVKTTERKLDAIAEKVGAAKIESSP